MAITAEQQQAINKYTVGLFNAPSGGFNAELAAYVEAGNTPQEMALVLAGSPAFKNLDPAYGDDATNEEFATAFLNNLLGDTVTAATMEGAIAFVVDMLETYSRAEVAVAAIDFIDDASVTSPTFGAAAQQLDNRVEVATYYNEDFAGDSTDLTVLQGTIDGVTEDPATVEAALAELGGEFTLASGLADLDAAIDSKSDFLQAALDNEDVADWIETNALDADNPTNEEIENAIGAVETAKAAAIDALVPGYSDASATLQEAKLQVAETENAEALTVAQENHAEALADIDAVPGLTAAIAAYEDAETAYNAAVKASDLADAAETAANANFDIENGAVVSTIRGDADLTNDTVTVDGDTVIEYSADEEEFVLAAGVTEEDYVGVTAYLDAINAAVAADAAEVAAETAKDLALATVDYFDASDDGTLMENVANAMVFSSPAIESQPTAAEIEAETEMFADRIAALDSLAAANGDTDYANVLTTLTAALNAATTVAEVETLTLDAFEAGYITAADKAAIDDSADTTANATESAILAENNWQDRSDDFGAAVAALEGAEGAEPGIGALYDAAYGVGGTEELLEDAQDAIAELADAVAAFEDATILADGLDDADDAIDAVIAEFTDAGYAAPVILDGGIELSTSEDDIFIDGGVDTEVRSMGILGEDTLYVGTDLVYNETVIGTGTGETALTEAGDVAALEFFLIETATAVEVFVEDKAYGSETGDGYTIELVGVTLDDVTVADGFITVA